MQLPINKLHAVALAAATEETRYYLNGVHIEPHPRKTGVILTATNGHVLISAYHDTGFGEPFAPVIIPLKLITRIKAVRKIPDLTMTLTPAEVSILYAGATYAAPPVDGTFPDWRRVVPRNCDGTPAQYDSKYLAVMTKAKSLLSDANTPALVSYNGESPALVDLGTDEAFGVIMPFRTQPERSTPPAWID